MAKAGKRKSSTKKVSSKTPARKIKKASSSGVVKAKSAIPKPPATLIMEEKPITPETGSLPVQKIPEMKTGSSIQPAFDLLPPWESKSVLNDFYVEEGIAFVKSESQSFLAKSGKNPDDSVHGYFLIEAKKGKETVGAIDGFALNEVLVITRSRASGEKKRELHSLLFCAALAFSIRNMKPKAVLFSSPRSRFSEDVAGKLMFLGRSAGMQALSNPDMHLFIRRLGKEHDMIADGKELAALLKGASPAFKFDKMISELEKKGPVPLVPLPISPDTSGRLHELEDSVPALGYETSEMGKIIEKLKEEYVYDRKDITPESL